MSKYIVSIEQCELESTIEKIVEVLRMCLDNIGGITNFIRDGDSVAIKPNLVANPNGHPYAMYKNLCSFSTDPRVVFALVKLCHELGAAKISIVETLEPIFGDKYAIYGYRDLAKKFSANLIDLNIGSYKEIEIPNPYYLRRVRINETLFNYDKTINVPKLKVHSAAGFSLGLKNLIGLTPATDRKPFHQKDPQLGNTLPYAIVDLNKIYETQLTVIDGLLAVDKTEHYRCIPVEMDVLIAGRNIVATDTIGALVMGLNPTTDYPNAPFILDRNHLNLAKESKLGENEPDKIEVRGYRIEDVQKQFTVDPKRRKYDPSFPYPRL